MRIDEIVAQRQASKPSSVKARLFTYIHDHPEEVFGYRDEELARAIDAKPSAVGFALWSLHEKGFVQKTEIAGKVYFGSRDAIQALRKRLLPDEKEEDVWDRVDRFREEVFQKYGYIDVKDLLEETREGR